MSVSAGGVGLPQRDCASEPLALAHLLLLSKTDFYVPFFPDNSMLDCRLS
jgi:hypothetical protein